MVMRAIKNRIMAVVLLLAFSGCTAIKDIALTQDVEEFSHATDGLSQIVSANFALTEKINSIAAISNIQFQLELGGKPDTAVKPLFTADSLAKRQEALNLLTSYAHTLAALVQNSGVSTESLSIPAAVNAVQSFDYRDFDLTHTLKLADAKTLVKDLSIFQELFILPKRDAKLAKIVETGNRAVKRVALLLYVDMGEKADQSADCSFTVPARNSDNNIASLRLCRGGLRAIADTAFQSELTIWKSKLSLLSGTKDATQSANRLKMVQRIVGIQKAAQVMDQLLAGTQTALISMVAAHGSLLDLLTSDNKTLSLTSAQPTKTVLFLEKVAALAAAVKLSGAALDSLQSSNATVTDLQGLGDTK